MIPVRPAPEPPDFDAKVRQPGLIALAEARTDPLPPYWTTCLDDLWRAYHGVCAYLAVRIAPGTGARSTDHAAPKSKHPALAYEWSNYRLVCALMNSRKQAFEDVLDPFEVEPGWFRLELSSLEVLPGEGLSDDVTEAVQKTIRRLKLNDAECVAARDEHYDRYLQRRMDFDTLRRWSPFVALELARQGLRAVIDAQPLDDADE